MLKYAREDTHYLLFIFDSMRVELLKAAKDQNPSTFLKSVWNRSRQISLGVYEKPKVKDMEYYKIMT
jgi:exosome complex exonuclease RRP6